jgi:hypothetical protein
VGSERGKSASPEGAKEAHFVSDIRPTNKIEVATGQESTPRFSHPLRKADFITNREGEKKEGYDLSRAANHDQSLASR